MLKIFSLKNNNIRKEHINFYNNEGYLVLRNIFSKKEVKFLDNSIIDFADKDWHNIMNPDRIEFLLSQSISNFNEMKSFNLKVDYILKAKKTSKLFRSYLIDSRVKKILEKLTGKKIVGLMTHIIFKHANSKYAKLAWKPHQDNSYAKMKNNGYITTNLFINKCFKENGTLYLYPGSHKNGLLKSSEYFSYHARKNQNPGNRVKLKLSDLKKIDLKINAGDYLIMNGNLVHGSYGNFSRKHSRHLLSFNYGIKNLNFSPGYTARRQAIDL